jgi:hypothetical protein
METVSAIPLAPTSAADTANAGHFAGTLDLNRAAVPYGFVFYEANNGLALYIFGGPVERRL